MNVESDDYTHFLPFLCCWESTSPWRRSQFTSAVEHQSHFVATLNQRQRYFFIFHFFHHQENQCNVISLYNVDKYTYDHFLTWGRVRRYVATDCKCLCSKLRNIFFSSKINSLGNCKGNSPWLSVVVFLQNCFISCQPLDETGAWNGLRWSQEGLWNKMKKSWQSSRLDKT